MADRGRPTCLHATGLVGSQSRGGKVGVGRYGGAICGVRRYFAFYGSTVYFACISHLNNSIPTAPFSRAPSSVLEVPVSPRQGTGMCLGHQHQIRATLLISKAAFEISKARKNLLLGTQADIFPCPVPGTLEQARLVGENFHNLLFRMFLEGAVIGRPVAQDS